MARQKKNKNHSAKDKEYLLEITNLAVLAEDKKKYKERLKFHWNYYSELARQRSAVSQELYQALIQTCVSHEFKGWQRATKYAYSLHPLSTVGSVQFIGGRFNTGQAVNSEVPSFGSLYIANNKETAFQEHLGQEPIPDNSKLTALERALMNPNSESIISLDGKLDKVFDLTNIRNLAPFVSLIKEFRIPKNLKMEARNLDLGELTIVKTTEELCSNLLDPHWRRAPSNFDVPANSQIFGHLIYSAGIEGILYPSKFTQAPCLALFPKNFVGTDSYVEINGDLAHPSTPRRVDATNWRHTELTAKEIIEV